MPKRTKKPTRGAGVSVTLPTEPLAGDAKTTPVMAVMVQDDGTPILEYEVKEGQSIQFRVGGTVKAFMERVGPAPDADMFLDSDGGNVESVTIEYEHALSGFQTVSLQPRTATQYQPCSFTALGNDRAKLGVKEMAENHNRPTKHQHHPDTCQWLGCKATDKNVEAILSHSVEVTRKVREQELQAQRRFVPDFHMGDYEKEATNGGTSRTS